MWERVESSASRLRFCLEVNAKGSGMRIGNPFLSWGMRYVKEKLDDVYRC